MSEDIAASVISRCLVSSIEETLKRWGRLTQTQVGWLLEKKPTKSQIVKKLCKIIEQNDLNQEILGDLELAYVQLHSRRKQWKVYKLKGKSLKLNIDPRSLRSRLVSHIKLCWRDGQVNGNMNMFAGAMWLRVHLDSSNVKRKKSPSMATPRYKHHQSVFMVLFQHSPFVVVSATSQRITKIVSEALQHVLGADSLSVQLTGRHVASLADLVHQQHYEALSTRFREKEEAENSLCPKRKRKRGVTSDLESVDGIIDENRKEKVRRLDFVKENFGDDSQPELETVNYRFNSTFHGFADLACVCSVELKGRSVLQGVCDAVKAGVVKCPVPKHIMAITSRAQNSFLLESKKK